MGRVPGLRMAGAPQSSLSTEACHCLSLVCLGPEARGPGLGWLIWASSPYSLGLGPTVGLRGVVPVLGPARRAGRLSRGECPLPVPWGPQSSGAAPLLPARCPAPQAAPTRALRDGPVLCRLPPSSSDSMDWPLGHPWLCHGCGVVPRWVGPCWASGSDCPFCHFLPGVFPSVSLSGLTGPAGPPA